MFSFPLSLFLAPFALVLLFIALMALITIYHLVKYAATTQISFYVTFAYLVGTVFILFFMFVALKDTNWDHRIEVNNIFDTSSSVDDFAL